MKKIDVYQIYFDLFLKLSGTVEVHQLMNHK